MTLSALAGSSTITDAALCRHRPHLLNEAGQVPITFWCRRGSSIALHGSNPTEPVWMFDADNFSVSLLERTSQIYFMSQGHLIIYGLNGKKTKGMLFSLDTVALNGCLSVSVTNQTSMCQVILNDCPGFNPLHIGLSSQDQRGFLFVAMKSDKQTKQWSTIDATGDNRNLVLNTDYDIRINVKEDAPVSC